MMCIKNNTVFNNANMRLKSLHTKSAIWNVDFYLEYLFLVCKFQKLPY